MNRTTAAGIAYVVTTTAVAGVMTYGVSRHLGRPDALALALPAALAALVLTSSLLYAAIKSQTVPGPGAA